MRDKQPFSCHRSFLGKTYENVQLCLRSVPFFSMFYFRNTSLGKVFTCSCALETFVEAFVVCVVDGGVFEMRFFIGFELGEYDYFIQ